MLEPAISGLGFTAETIKKEKLIRILLTLLKHEGRACVTGTGELPSF